MVTIESVVACDEESNPILAADAFCALAQPLLRTIAEAGSAASIPAPATTPVAAAAPLSNALRERGVLNDACSLAYASSFEMFSSLFMGKVDPFLRSIRTSLASL